MELNLKNYPDRQKFYQTESWRNLRNYKLFMNPFCQECSKIGVLKVANEVHHIVDLSDNSNLALEYTNLKSLCKSCHSKITYNDKLKDKKVPPKLIEPFKRKWNMS